MNKVLLVLSENSTVKEISDRCFSELERIDQEILFAKRGVLALLERKTGIENKHEGEIIEVLRDLGKLPAQWNKETDTLNIDRERDCVLWHQHSDECGHAKMKEFLETIFS